VGLLAAALSSPPEEQNGPGIHDAEPDSF
jgi:hypothetical protein